MKEQNKKNRIIVILLLLGIAVTVFLGFIIYNIPSNRLARQLDLGEKYLEEENYEQAVVEFDKVIAIDPMCVDAYLGKAEAYAGLGDIDMALQTLEEGYARTGSERLRERIEEISNVQTQKEPESLELRELETETPDDIIEFPFELTDITVMGYDLFTDHYEDICAAYGCPVDTDPSSDSVSVNNEYGDLLSDVYLSDGTEKKSFGFYQSTETISYPGFSYFTYTDSVNISIYSSFDRAADLESCGIHVPAQVGSYEEWSRMLQVQEIKEKGNPQEREDGAMQWDFQTKWGTAHYIEDEEYAELEIYLNRWVGENSYSGMFCIERYVDFAGQGLGEEWYYRYFSW